VADSASNLPDEVLGHLQHTLLWSVLSGEALPGGRRPVKMPDLSFVQRQSPILLLSDNLAKSVSLDTVPIPVRVLSREDIVEEARERGDIACLRFQPALEKDDTIGLTLEAKIFPQDPGQHALGLSGLQVKFTKLDGQWVTIEEPRFFAT
jgi:hypothetical protein